jgi:hypothetical protein
MASVFLSYDRDDANTARPIAAALEKAGHSVWWDRQISGGSQFAKEIEQALNNADVVVVLWTSSSVESPWVRDEAGAGRDRGRLVPLSLDETLPPLGFRQFHSIDLGQWSGRGKIPRLKDILAAIERQLNAPGIPEAVEKTSVRRTSFRPMNKWAVAVVAIGMFFVIVGLLIGRPWDRRGVGGASVAISAADASASSMTMAREVLATLGTLQGNSRTSFRLLEDQTGGHPDLRVSVASAESNGNSRATVALVLPKDNAVLWSRQIEQANNGHANLERAVAFSAMAALTCAVDDSGSAPDLRTSDFRAYLSACASSEEVADPQPSIAVSEGRSLKHQSSHARGRIYSLRKPPTLPT